MKILSIITHPRVVNNNNNNNNNNATSAAPLTCVWYSSDRVSKTDTEEKNLLNKFVIFIFLLTKLLF